MIESLSETDLNNLRTLVDRTHPDDVVTIKSRTLNALLIGYEKDQDYYDQGDDLLNK